jgi:hypothetical protein
MKKLTLFLLASCCCFCMMAQPPKGPANKGMSFGEKTTAEGAVNPDQLPLVLGDKSTAPVKVKGKVAEVCKMEGCWLKMQTASGPMMIRMKDEAFLVPLAMNGKTIVAQGIASIKETSVEMLRHYAKDAGKTPEEIEAIKEPKKEMMVEATGILVL